MKKVHRYMPDVPQAIADRGTEIVERHFQAYGVKRASDLPEEGRVHLFHEMQVFLAAELPSGSGDRLPRRGLARWIERVKGFFDGE